jgi:ribonuclease PH
MNLIGQVRVESVLFEGTAHELRALLLQWNALRGVDVKVKPNDHVGGSFDVSFSRKQGGVAIPDAQEWVARALRKSGS